MDDLFEFGLEFFYFAIGVCATCRKPLQRFEALLFVFAVNGLGPAGSAFKIKIKSIIPILRTPVLGYNACFQSA